MTPFPEAEIMTIKRLEVALRKLDLKLLKDGAYKLHEKYHSGHKFEHLDFLKEIYDEINNNSAVPSEIKDILKPTIEDILAQNSNSSVNTSTPYETNENRVSSLTSLSYSTEAENHQDSIETSTNNLENNQIETPKQDETRLSAFDTFGAPKHQETYSIHQKHLVQSPFSAQPFKEFSTPQVVQYLHPTEAPSNEPSYEQNIEEQNETIEQVKPIEKKSVSIFYGQDNSIEKIKNILKLREMITNSKKDKFSIFEMSKIISEISLQSNCSVDELKNILEQIKSKVEKISLVTNSQSALFTELLDEINYQYELYQNKNDIMNLVPLYGLTNVFVCSECQENFVVKNNVNKPYILECSKCKNPMYPDLYPMLENSEINMNYYNSAIINLTDAKVWALIHPTFSDKTSFDLLKTALKISNKIEEIYIIDKDINTKETCRNIFQEINSNVRIYTQGNVAEDFLKNL